MYSASSSRVSSTSSATPLYPSHPPQSPQAMSCRRRRFVEYTPYAALITLVIVALVLFLPFNGGHLPKFLPTIAFPKSGTEGDSISPPWLIAVMSAAHLQQRRNIIRATWQSMYADPTRFTTRFVLAEPSAKEWWMLLKAENETYGDLIVLEGLEESAHVANTIKTIEFFRWLTGGEKLAKVEEKKDETASDKERKEKERSGKDKKIQMHSRTNATRFWDQYLQPLLDSAAKTTDDEQTEAENDLSSRASSSSLQGPNRTIVAKSMTNYANTRYPGGQFYTLTADLVALLPMLYNTNPKDWVDEDLLVGELLQDAQVEWEMVGIPNRQAFDVTYPYDGPKATGEESEDEGIHWVGEGAINPHKMKGDDMYLEVAGLFGEDGFVGVGN
ncbi:glycosyltransferase family 31 protein [Aulographum hederae CBS 113979]|uniref:Hexosyltransferase n=1 Tax=Aulographum hederae CBS 113979 TaxID=1176131 RepID=A0A6G1HBI2_9PEZI|nr:glycosyltransferase family 31 protein [Aulographum hederae CBS 113979]